MTLDSQGLSLFEAARAMGVAFQSEVQPRDKEVTLEGMRLHYLDWGHEGLQPVIFLHGNAQQSHSWDFVSLALCGSYHVVAPDARGHGDSAWAPDGDYTTDAYVRDLERFVDTLALDSFILVGHSMGGRTCYIYAAQFPERLKALAIVDSGPTVRPQGVSRMERFKQLPDQLDSYEEFVQRVHQYTGRPREQLLGSLRYSVRQLPSGKWTWKYDKVLRTPGSTPTGWPVEKQWDCLARIHCPTLIVRGSESDVFVPETMARMLEVIPNSTSVTVTRAGHLVAGDNPTDLAEALRTFLQRVP